MAYLDMGGDFLEAAHDPMLEVLEERKNTFGKEQSWTLLAICNLVRVKSAIGDTAEAERRMRGALAIARRNLGDNHFRTLAWEAHLAQILVRQKRYDEAEQMLTSIVKRQRYESPARDDWKHPHRILCIWYLVQCYQAHGKIRYAIACPMNWSRGLSTIGGQGFGSLHPFAERVRDTRSPLELLTTKNGESNVELATTIL